jgi:hypothetical protein
MSEGSEREEVLVGVIFDTNSRGRYDLAIYTDGILAVRGNYVRAAIFGAASGGGVSAGALAGVVGSSAARGVGGRRAAKFRFSSRRELLDANPSNYFVRQELITRLVVQKRWSSHSLEIHIDGAPEVRRYVWKPGFNRFSEVHRAVTIVFGDRVSAI